MAAGESGGMSMSGIISWILLITAVVSSNTQVLIAAGLFAVAAEIADINS